jgi:hypothetical protein
VCGVLPALFRVGRITHRAVTRATHRPTLQPLGGGDPARLVARDDVARWRELHVVTAVSWTAECDRLRLPDLIMPVGLPHECVGDFMQERVVNRLVCGVPCIRVGERDDPRLVVAAARACRRVIKLETPALELEYSTINVGLSSGLLCRRS